jgi:hypothetical protein
VPLRNLDKQTGKKVKEQTQRGIEVLMNMSEIVIDKSEKTNAAMIKAKHNELFSQ